VELKRSLHRLTVSDFMSTEVVSLSPEATLAEVVEGTFMRHDFHAYPVVQDGQLVGLLACSQVSAVPAERWGATRVGEIMRPLAELPVLAPDQAADEALERMTRADENRLPVARAGGGVGVLSTRDIARRVAWTRRARGE
jgi:predicted transcriptional regulator